MTPIPTICIEEVRSKRDLDSFVKLPWKIYKGDPNWVPPLIGDLKKFLSRDHNPFFLHSDAAYFLARKNGEAVGRIAAIENKNHNVFAGETTAFFGFFESVDDPLVASALLERVAEWARARGLDRLRGPACFSTNDECAMLIDGFDGRPSVMMPYNPPYYPLLMEKAGFMKVKDLVAYHLNADTVPSRMIRLGEEIGKRESVTVRPIDMRHYREDVDRFREVYNNAWERNWGFVPMTDEEIDHMAKTLKPAVDPQLVLYMEKDGKTIGFALALPDVNQAVQHANGRLFPLGLIKILYHARKIRKVRVLVLGLLKEYRGRGLDVLLYVQLYRNGLRRNYNEGEFSWILEDNVAIRRPLEKLGARVYRTYRFYERSIS
jgi:GNAT superfamily N-acetyltransferase